LYGGGGAQYRFQMGPFSLTPFLGLVVHKPTIKSVFGTAHLLHLGVRGELAIAQRTKIIVSYGHFSNGSRLGLSNPKSPNQGIESIGIGIGRTF